MNIVEMVNRDFELAQNLTDEKLKAVLINSFEYLLNNDFPKMLQILYRTDVNEERLKLLLSQQEGNSIAEIITEEYINRIKQKVETWNKYSK